MSVVITLPDGNTKEFEGPVSGLEIAKSIHSKLAKAALGITVNGETKDLNTTIDTDATVSIITDKDPEGLEVIRHSTAHLMAMAIKELWPETLLAIGPVIDDGFYYDLDSEHKFTPEDFAAIEKKMKALANQALKIERHMINREEAKTKWQAEGEIYKVDLLENFDENTTEVSYYTQGDFYDLCTGPHVPQTGKLKHFKILSVAGAYWRGDEKNKMLQRIYATAFASKEELDAHLNKLEEAKKRDHRKLGKELDLFHMEEHSPGMIFWHPKGAHLYNSLVDYVRENLRHAGYHEVKTPEVVEKTLWEKSGHWDKYADMMFVTKSENKEMAIKPMNCPCHIEIFKQGIKSFRELPLRFSEFGKCHRNELAGTMHGLMRVRGFTQDDAHIFCTHEQISREVADFCNMVKRIYADFGFTDIITKFSTRPEKRVGSDDVWDKAEAALDEALKLAELECELNPGEGAFYGPKLEFVLKDCLGRHWQCGTIQVDFNLPERLGATYVEQDGQKYAPVMLHRAILGSLERFIGILIEEFAGDFPLWLNPLHCRVLPISEKFQPYAEEVHQGLLNAGLLSELDTRNEKIGYKIREGEKGKVPYLVIVGEKEENEKVLSIRKRKEGDKGQIKIEDFISQLKSEIANKGK